MVGDFEGGDGGCFASARASPGVDRMLLFGGWDGDYDGETRLATGF